jgi:histidyl-tRNA synthetase
MKKQMNYADARAIPFVALVGETEMASGLINLKDMTTGGQRPVSESELMEALL